MGKRLLLTFAGVIFGFILTIPMTKYKLKEHINPIEIPERIEELDKFIQEKESKISGITPNMEKHITWFDGKKEKTKFSIIYFHGFGTGGPETAPLTQLVAKELKANIFFTRLKGHGLPGEEFAKAKGNDWLNDAVEAHKIASAIGERVIMIGSSTGCLLALWLAERPEYNKNIEALVLMSANIHPKTKLSKLSLYPAGIGFIKMIYGPNRTWKPWNDEAAKYWSHDYPWEVTTTLMTMVDYASNFKFEEMETPILFLYTEHDEVIDINLIKEVHGRYKSGKKKIINFSDSKMHIMAGDILSPETTIPIKNEIIKYFN
ncbi:MAG: alpha/beta hydrolase, partial [Leptospiraceae bacterium]|nr:alpha/beta hydrolase [Leptospiraceae bacterium]